jgi:hypothetical protein
MCVCVLCKSYSARCIQRQIWADIQDGYREFSTPNRLGKLTDPKKPHKTWPVLSHSNAKCAQVRSLCPVLAMVVGTKYANPANPYHQDVVNFLMSLSKVYDIVGRNGHHLVVEDIPILIQNLNSASQALQDLHDYTDARGRKTWHITNKAHVQGHLGDAAI